jgi:hypothetical protein
VTTIILQLQPPESKPEIPIFSPRWFLDQQLCAPLFAGEEEQRAEAKTVIKIR